MYRVTVSSKGHVVIPVVLRKKLALGHGTGLRVYEQGGKIILVPEVSDPVGHGLGLLTRTGQGTDKGGDGIA